LAAGMYGADVEQLRSLAKKFETSGSNLLNVIRTLDHYINSTDAWRGPDAERFRSNWNERDRLAVTRSAEALNEGASALARNAEEQQQASAANGASSHGSVPGGSQTSMTASGAPGDSQGGATDERAVIEMYHDLRQLKLGGLTISDEAVMVGKIIGGGFLEKAGYVVDAADLIDAVSHGEWGDAASVLTKTAGDTIKNFGPVGYLVGANISVWTDVVNEASKADWSEEARLQVVDYATQNPWDALDAVVEAEMNFLPNLVMDVWPAKLGLFSR